MTHAPFPSMPLARWWLLLYLPSALLTLGARLAASLVWLADLRGCRRTLSPLIRQATSCSTWRSQWWAWQATCNAFLYTVDSARLLLGPDAGVRARARRSTFEGAEHLQRALSVGRGVVLAASFHACFYDALLARFGAAWPGLDETPLHLVLPRRDPLLERMCERIVAQGGRRCRFILMDSPVAAVLMTRALRRGEMVLCMVDNVPEEAAVVVVPFLGRPTLMPAGFLLLAGRSASPVLTCHTVRRAGRFVTRLTPIETLPAAATDVASHDVLQWQAEALAAQVERPIRHHPGGWNSWLTLAPRWQAAAGLKDEP